MGRNIEHVIKVDGLGKLLLKSKKLFFLLLTTAFLSGCTSSKDAYRALDDAGFTDVEMTGYKPFACSKGDFFNTGFKAKNPNGKIIEGVVCSGLLFKNSTIRFD